jgi:predicted RNase H-related nuclease YkuK (DUF458 family)
MGEFIEKMDIDILKNNVIIRNVAMESLRIALKELKKGRKEINYMAIDPCHVETDSIVHEDYGCIIREITQLIKTMVGGDWCFSVNSTAEREKDIKDEIKDEVEKKLRTER